MEEKVIGGRYEYRRSLGKGGNGSVFLCYDIKLQKEWAVKELCIWEDVGVNEVDGGEKLCGTNDEKLEIMKGVELELLKTISCNLFPRIVDVVYEQEKVYLVMDYVEGVTLKEKMQRQKLTEKDVLPWAVEIAKALRYLHQMSPQILYMDCKPENIILTPQGEIRLVDLGSVYICGSEKKQRISGTRFFSPKEQQNAGRKALKYSDGQRMEQEGTGQILDVRSDIYAFGMTLYYLLAGKKKIYRRQGSLSIRDANPTVCYGLSAVIARCTQKEPQKRLQSMDEVLYQLAHIKEIGRQERIKKCFEKAATLFGKLVCIVGILIGAWLYASRKEQPVLALAGSLGALIVFLFLCTRRRFCVYEVKKELFCGSGKRILLYLILFFGVLQIMTVSVFAEEKEELHELEIVLYDWQGRKLLLKDGAVWKVSEDILLSIPLEELSETEGKITVLYEEKDSGNVKKYMFLCCKK